MPAGITETPNGSTPDEAQLQTAADSAQENVEEQESSLEDLKARLTNQGRQNKSLSTKISNLEKQVAESKEQFEKADRLLREYQDFVYTGKTVSDADKAAYAQRQAAATQSQRSTSVVGMAMWKEIAKEENPTLRTTLTEMAESGDYLSVRQIQKLRESLPATESEGEPKKRTPAAVTATSGAAAEGSLQQKLEAAKARAKAGDREAVDEIFRINSHIAAAQQRVSRG